MQINQVGMKKIVFIFLGLASFLINIEAQAYIDEYNNYNANPNYNNGSYGSGPGQTGASGPNSTGQGLQSALQVFQDVDCEHLGCDNNKKDFFDKSGAKSKEQTFQITPSDSNDNSVSSSIFSSASASASNNLGA